MPSRHAPFNRRIMRKSIIFKLLVLSLAALMLFLTACGNQTPEPETEKPETEGQKDSETAEQVEDKYFDLAEKDGDTFVVRIIRNDYSDNKAGDVLAAVDLASGLAELLGTRPSLITDFTDKDSNESIKEICVGKTNRVCSTSLEGLGTDDYRIVVEENKIFIVADSDGAYQEAVAAFLASLKDASGNLKNPKVGTVQNGHWVDPEKVIDDGKEKVLYGLSQDQADEFFADILDGIFTGDTVETVDTVKMGADFRMHFPDMVYYKDTYYAYYICGKTNNGKGGVGLATSKDGVTWKDYGCVIEPEEDYDCDGAYFAGAWRDTDGKWYCVYECKGTIANGLESVALAVSDDGVIWEKEGIIVQRDQASWQSANVGTPDIYKADDTWYVFFHGFDYKTCQIGVAYGKDLHHLTLVKNPIIPTQENTLWSGTTGRRDVIYVGGWYYMVYEISTEQPYGSAYWTHMFARSKDLITWETCEGPLIRRTDAAGTPMSGMGYDGPCWCIVGKHLYVYFRNPGNVTYRAELTLGD